MIQIGSKNGSFGVRVFDQHYPSIPGSVGKRLQGTHGTGTWNKGLLIFTILGKWKVILE